MDGYDSGKGVDSSAAAYGSQGATGNFDPVLFIKKPQVILRLISSVGYYSLGLIKPNAAMLLYIQENMSL